MKPKEQLTLMVAALTLLGCHILSKDKLTLKKLNQKEEFQLREQRTILSQQNQLVLLDSSQSDFTLLLYPKGKFTFSVTEGFEGEAEKILIKGKQTSQKVINLKQESRQDSVLLQASYHHEKESSIQVKKNKVSFGNSWVWVLLVPAGYVLYWLYKHYV